MAIWGKIIGGGVGMMIGGPLGALLGVAGGHFWDKSQQPEASEAGDLPAQNQMALNQMAFSVAVIALSAKMAKADGRVSSDEIRAFKKIFRFDAADQSAVAQIYRDAQQTSAGFRDYAAQAKEIFGGGAVILEELLWALAEIAKADGRLHENEMSFLREVAKIFALTPEVFARINALEIAGQDADPYTILGIKREASDEELKKHYRNLVRKFHPDRLIAQGLPEEAVENSGRKLAAINESYDRITAERGLH